MADGIPTDPPNSREIDFGALVKRALGDEYHKHEKVYDFSKGRTFESSDYGTHGVYRRADTIVRSGTSTEASISGITLGPEANGSGQDYVGKVITISVLHGTGTATATSSSRIVAYDETTRSAKVAPGWPNTSLHYVTAAFNLAFEDAGSGRVSLMESIGNRTPTFTRATIATTVDSAGLVKQVAAGVPRSYYDPTSLTYLGYLAEGARTNRLLRSEEFDNASWTKENATISADAVAAPDGTTTADKLAEDATAGGQHRVRQAVTITAGATVAVSCWMKAAERTWGIVHAFSGSDVVRAWFDLSAGAVGTVLNGGSGSGAAATIEAWNDGWYRCVLTGIVNGTSTSIAAAVQTAPANGTIVFDGVEGDGLYAWGAQCEQASFPSTYIPTTTAAVTRNADVLTYPTTGWLNASAGTIFDQFQQFFDTTGANWIQVSMDQGDGSLGERITLYQVSDANWGAVVVDNAVNQAVPQSGAASANTTAQQAMAYKENDFAISANGAAAVLDTSGTLPTVTTLAIGHIGGFGAHLFGPIRRVTYWGARLANTDLQVLTSDDFTLTPYSTSYSIAL